MQTYGKIGGKSWQKDDTKDKHLNSFKALWKE